jgi:hypothetical protein
MSSGQNGSMSFYGSEQKRKMVPENEALAFYLAASDGSSASSSQHSETNHCCGNPGSNYWQSQPREQSSNICQGPFQSNSQAMWTPTKPSSLCFDSPFSSPKPLENTSAFFNARHKADPLDQFDHCERFFESYSSFKFKKPKQIEKAENCSSPFLEIEPKPWKTEIKKNERNPKIEGMERMKLFEKEPESNRPQEMEGHMIYWDVLPLAVEKQIEAEGLNIEELAKEMSLSTGRRYDLSELKRFLNDETVYNGF